MYMYIYTEYSQTLILAFVNIVKHVLFLPEIQKPKLKEKRSVIDVLTSRMALLSLSKSFKAKFSIFT